MSALLASTLSRSRPRVLAEAMVVLLAASALAWGLRAAFIEGFEYPRQRGFAGDFTSLMYSRSWDGSDGIFYGPIFVIERWMTFRFPVLDPLFFAILNWLILAVAFAACALALRLRPPLLLVAATGWILYSRTTYALAIVAHPEFLELLFICLALAAATRGRRSAEGVLLALSGLTKLIPWVFVALVAIRRSVAGLLAGGATAVAVIAIVCVGQRRDPLTILRGTLFPFGGVAEGDFLATVWVTPEFLGLNTAIARLIGYGNATAQVAPPPATAFAIHTVTVLTVAACFAAAVWTALRLTSTSGRRARQLTLCYAVWLPLIPLLTLQAHSHTFIFLLPAWTIMLQTLVDEERDTLRRLAFGALFASAYVYAGLPLVGTIVDRLSGASIAQAWGSFEPAWSTIATLLGIAGYVAAAHPSSVKRSSEVWTSETAAAR